MASWNPNKQGKFRNSIGEEGAKRPTPQERNTFVNEVIPERAILVSVCPSGQTVERTEDYLDELEFLLRTAGGVTVKKVIQRLERPDTRTYVGSGKLEEIKEYKQALDADIIVVDDELSPAQLRNLEKSWTPASSTAPPSSSTSSPATPAPPLPAPRSNSPSSNTCSPVSPAFGPTSNASAAASACAVPVKRR